MADDRSAPTGEHPGRALARALGPIGVWTFEAEKQAAAEEGRFARAVEALGFPALWIPESVSSKEVFAHAGLLLAATDRLIVATGIANIYARDPVAMANGARTLAEAYPGRFVLGLGVSHKPAVERRGGTYGRPIAEMRAYLDAMAASSYSGPAPDPAPPVVLAALGPRMLELAAERAAGAHPYFVPAEHTAFAREHLGPGPLLAVEQAVILEEDPAVARAIARRHTRRYLAAENYVNNLRRMGWADADTAGDGSDALVDAVVAWGSPSGVAARIRRHLADGADHVAIQALPTDGRPALDQLGALAAELRPR